MKARVIGENGRKRKRGWVIQVQSSAYIKRQSHKLAGSRVREKAHVVASGFESMNEARRPKPTKSRQVSRYRTCRISQPTFCFGQRSHLMATLRISGRVDNEEIVIFQSSSAMNSWAATPFEKTTLSSLARLELRSFGSTIDQSNIDRIQKDARVVFTGRGVKEGDAR